MNRSAALSAILSALLLLTLPGAVRAADLQAELKGLADNERAFAAMASEPDKTVRDAFLHFAADDGVVLGAEGPANAKAAFNAAPPPPPGTPKLQLLWWPVHAEIASSADLGWTTGPSKRIRGDQIRYGFFVTVWKKQPDGTWRFLIDQGIQTDEMSTLGPDTPIPPISPALAEKARGEIKPVDTRAELDRLMAADRELSKVTAAGDKAGWLDRMSDDGRVLRNGPQPAVGREAARAALEKDPPVTTEPLGGGVSAAGDLGFTYGKGTWKKGSAGDATEPVVYLRIWEKQGDTWKLALDEVTSAAPPPPPTPPTPPKKDG